VELPHCPASILFQCKLHNPAQIYQVYNIKIHLIDQKKKFLIIGKIAYAGRILFSLTYCGIISNLLLGPILKGK
jgi:hypothetical protein